MLIEELPFLIEKKVLKECEGKSEKEIFTLKIDAIRKSLEINSMEDVELLVQTFYDWSAMKWAEREQQNMGEGEEEEADYSPNRDDMMPNRDEADDLPDPMEDGSRHDDMEEADEDDEELVEIEEEDIVEILRKFQANREEAIKNAAVTGKPQTQKQSVIDSEDTKKEDLKHKEKKFWQDMTTVLSERKLRVWNALDKALAKYYNLLVQRKNLIEETGTLNQQGQELKTLMNQYL